MRFPEKEVLFEGGKLDSAWKRLMERRRSRRELLQSVGVASAVVAGSGLATRPAEAQGNLDVAVLQFALNLEYLEAEFYLRATTGSGLSAVDAGVGAGTVTIKPNAQVPFFPGSLDEQYANEIAQDEAKHVRFLRAALASAGVAPVSRPDINLLTSFNTAAQLAGLGMSFDPFANNTSFLLGAYLFEDVGVSAYKGGLTLLRNKAFLEATAGILSAESYHAGEIRLLLNAAGNAAINAAQRISDLRDNVDNQDGSGTPGDDRDQGLTENGIVNISLADANGLAYSRNTDSVLRIVYLGGRPFNRPTLPGTPGGGFYPNGMNGAIR